MFKSMQKTITILGDKQKDNALHIIQHLPYDEVHEVIIQLHKESLSSRQRRLYWLWLTEIANDRGETKEDMHTNYKGKFLTRIFYRDKATYAAMCDAIKKVRTREGMETEYNALKQEVTRLTSITDANVDQMREYLTEIDQDATMAGVTLTRPEDKNILGRE